MWGGLSLLLIIGGVCIIADAWKHRSAYEFGQGLGMLAIGAVFGAITIITFR